MRSANTILEWNSMKRIWMQQQHWVQGEKNVEDAAAFGRAVTAIGELKAWNRAAAKRRWRKRGAGETMKN